MNRRKFIGIAGASIAVAGGAAWLLSDRQHFVRDDINLDTGNTGLLRTDERQILYLASLAPSGHNTQPWIVRYLAPYHWIIGNDQARWLPAVDPLQRETMLSIGAFLQNLEYAAESLCYSCDFTLLAQHNQDGNIMEVKLKKSGTNAAFDTAKIKLRRTVRSGYQDVALAQEHVALLREHENAYIHFISRQSKEYAWLNEQTIEANRQQTYRDDAQAELADWMRLSSRDAKKHLDGLTTASMEINGIPGWYVRNFYDKQSVMSKRFRVQGLDKIREQVSHSGGWILLTSKDSSTSALLETGMRLQRMLLKIREKNIAIHPMTQILEEPAYCNALNSAVGIADTVQFILRAGYIKEYPDPVSLRRPVERFVQQAV